MAKVVGWAMDKHMEQGPVASALQMAATQRQPGEGVLKAKNSLSHNNSRGDLWMMRKSEM